MCMVVFMFVGVVVVGHRDVKMMPVTSETSPKICDSMTC